MTARKDKKKPRKIALMMFVSYIIASLLPLCIIVGYFIRINMTSADENLRQLAEPYCNQIVDGIMSVISEGENEIAILKSSSSMYDLLFTEYVNPADALAMYQSAWVNSTSHYINSDHTIKLYNTAEALNISALTNNSLDDFIRIYGEDAVQCDERIHYKLLPSYGTLPLRLALYTSYVSPDQQLYLTIEIPFTEILPYLEYNKEKAQRSPCPFPIKPAVKRGVMRESADRRR